MRRFYVKLIVTFCTVCLTVLFFFSYTAWEAGQVDFSEKTVSFSNLPKSFDGLRVLQISDLHARFLDDESLWDRLLSERPDLTVFTGDTFDRDSDEEDLAAVGEIVRRFAQVSKVYYVGGNHETHEDLWERAVTVVTENGGEVLSDRAVSLSRENEEISVVGLRDPLRRQSPDPAQKTQRDLTVDALETLSGKTSDFSLLLAHRPEDVEWYSRYGFDLVLSGHTHGGQIRLPLLGAVFAPSQGFFPKYSAGEYQVGDTTLYVSRGLGGEHRLLCPPEVTLFTLKTA